MKGLLVTVLTGTVIGFQPKNLMYPKKDMPQIFNQWTMETDIGDSCEYTKFWCKMRGSCVWDEDMLDCRRKTCFDYLKSNDPYDMYIELVAKSERVNPQPTEPYVVDITTARAMKNCNDDTDCFWDIGRGECLPIFVRATIPMDSYVPGDTKNEFVKGLF